MSRSTRIVLSVLGALVLAGVLAAFGWDRWTIRRLEAAEEAVRAAGLPTTVDQIRPPAIPDSDNAAPLVARMAEAFNSPSYKGSPERNDGIEARLFAIRERSPDYRYQAEHASDIAAILSEPIAAGIISLAHEAATKPGYDARLDYNKGVQLLIPQIGPLRAATELLRAHASLAAHRGGGDEACADIWAVFRLGDFLGSEPTLISQLSRLALHGIALEALQNLENARSISPEWNRRFSQRLLQIDVKPGLLRALDAERVCFGGDVFQRSTANTKVVASELADVLELEALRKISYIPRGLIRLEHAEYLDRMRAYRLEAERLWDQPTLQAQRLHEIASTIPRYRVLVNIVLPTISTVVEKAWQHETKLAVVAAGLVLERHLREHGGPPSSLTALEPEFPKARSIDRFTEKPLVLVQDGAAFRIYSFGRNRRDDGGIFEPAAEKDDLAFTVRLN